MKRNLVLSGILILVLFFNTSRGAAQWVRIANNFGGTVDCFVQLGSNLIAGSDGGGVFLSSDNGTTWSPINPGLQNKHVHALLVYQTALLAGTNGGVFLSSNSGNSWLPLNAGLADTTHVQALLLQGNFLFAGTSGGVFRATLTSNWVKIDTGFTDDYFINTFIISDTNLLAGTYVFGVWRSTDNGSHWDQSNTFMTKSDIHAFAQHDTDLFAATDGAKLFLSNDNGHTWPTGLSFPADTLNTLVFSGSNLFAGSNKGAARTTDNGTSWTDINTGLTDLDIRFLAVSNDRIFAAASDSSLWSRPLSEVIAKSDVRNTPLQMSGVCNFPNPFANQTTIGFSTSARSFVQITVINILGEEVARLLSGIVESGDHSVVWNAKKMAPGIYTCVIRIGSVNRMIPMVLLGR
jgi:photosystem II stability/assembly factor-like uncharacterized protein